MSAPADTDTAARTGRYGLLLIGILLIAANLRAAITAVGPVLGDIRTDLGLSGTAASILVSIPLVAFAMFSSVAPMLAAKCGMERSLGAALLVLAAAIVVRSLPSVPAVWLGTVFLGVGIAVLNVTLPALVKRDYPDQVGRITGVYSSVQSAAAAVGAGVAVPLAGVAVPLAGVTQSGWRLSLGIWAGLRSSPSPFFCRSYAIGACPNNHYRRAPRAACAGSGARRWPGR